MSASATRTGKRSRTSGVLVLLFASAYVAETLRFRVGFAADPIGPRAFPLLLGGSLLLLGAWLVARPDDGGDPWPAAPGRRRVLVAFAAFSIYPLALSWIGFVLATTAVLGVIALGVGASRATAVAASFTLSLALHGLGSYVFSSPLPRGRLFEILLA